MTRVRRFAIGMVLNPAIFNGMSFVDYGEDVSSAIVSACRLTAVAVPAR